MANPKIAIDDVGKIYKTRTESIESLNKFNLAIYEGEFVCLVGPSGCGKSTLLRILADITRQSSGEITVYNSPQATHPRISMVFQEYAVFPWRTVLGNVAFGPEIRGIPRRERREIAEHYLSKLGLTQFAKHYPHQLSGGMKQRVAIARSLANSPDILLMDEPFGALDAQTRFLLQNMLLTLWDEDKKTILYVTHSIEEAVMLGDRVVLMTARPGRVKRIFPVALPRPRMPNMRTSLEFNKLTNAIWEDLVVEVNLSDSFHEVENGKHAEPISVE